LVFEPRVGQRLPSLSRTSKRIREKTEEIIKSIYNLERKYRISPISKNFYFHITPAIEAYSRGEDFSKIRELTDIDEGELVRFLRMTIQILREIYVCPVIKDSFKDIILKSINSINRDIVDAERQLRLG
jgi:superfamily II RNA helicase